jgi:hypothetical protein
MFNLPAPKFLISLMITHPLALPVLQMSAGVMVGYMAYEVLYPVALVVVRCMGATAQHPLERARQAMGLVSDLVCGPAAALGGFVAGTGGRGKGRGGRGAAAAGSGDAREMVGVAGGEDGQTCLFATLWAHATSVE